MIRIVIAFICLCLPAIASASVTWSGASIRLLPPGVPNTAVYLRVENDSDQSVYIVGAESEVAERVELHSHEMVDGLMRMQQQERIEVPAGQSINFEPGGYHIMLFDLKHPLSPNKPVSVRLELDNGSNLEISAVPRKPQSEHHH